MPRANRHFLPGHVWHITHRCHQKAFLLKFARDRERWRHWLFEARKRYDLCILNYIVTSNHIHLLVQDQGQGEISKSMQLIAGRTGQEYNQRKGRKGAFWEDRYHATIVDTDSHLSRCLMYIDLNMVRTGMVSHPVQWKDSGYVETLAPPKRYGIINLPALKGLLGLPTVEDLLQVRDQWIEIALKEGRLRREGVWSESLAVGSEAFVSDIQNQLGIRARHRKVAPTYDAYSLRESTTAYMVDF